VIGNLRVLSKIPRNAEPTADGDKKETCGSERFPEIFTGMETRLPPNMCPTMGILPTIR